MSESLFVRLLGTVVALVGVAGLWVSFSTGATLFVPFAAALLLTGFGVQLAGWQRRDA